MIGPSSGANEVQNNDVDDNPVRAKRKIFEELDIDSFCDEVCQSAKKCNSINHDTLDMSEVIQFSSSEGLIQDIENGEPVTRLEVLVVDGTWDVSSLAGSDLIDFLPTLNCDSEISIGQNIEGIDNSYGTILSYWEPEISETEDILNNSVPTPVELPPSLRPASIVNQVPLCNQPDDQENGNLSWLLDFKLDSLIEAPEEKTSLPSSRVNNAVGKSRNHQATLTYLNDTKKQFNNENNESVIQPQTASGYSSTMDNRNYSSNRYGSSPKKPPFTYTELIEHALQEKGELTVSAIYQWISEHFPFYKSNDDRWKNSVRHNLSINPHFRKGSKAPHGAGHLWAIANREEMRPRQLTALQNFIANPTQKQSFKNNSEITIYPRKNTTENLTRQSVVVDEVAAATASITQPPEENVVPSVTLEHCAEQILNGIKREVEVQYLVPMNVQNNSSQKTNQVQSDEQACIEKETERDCWNVLADFLNPVSKEVVAEECGLIGEGYLVTDLNPTTLGLSMAESEITSENLFGEELSFQFYELTSSSSSSQIQSA